MCFIAFCLAYLGMSFLALSMRRHNKAVCNHKLFLVNNHKMQRIFGWVLLALALLISIVDCGVGTGLVIWFGQLTLAALFVALLLTYQSA